MKKVEETQNGYYITRENNLYGISNDTSNVIPCIYEDIEYLPKQLFFFPTLKLKVFDVDESELKNKKYQKYIIRFNEKFGILDAEFKILIPPVYSGIYIWLGTDLFIAFTAKRRKTAAEGFSWLYAKNNTNYYINPKFFLLDQEGKQIIHPIYDMIRPCNNHIAEVKVDGYVGMIDFTGKELVPPIYDSMFFYNYDWITIHYGFLQGNTLFIINEDGTIIERTKYLETIPRFDTLGDEDWDKDLIRDIIIEGKEWYESTNVCYREIKRVWKG